MTNIIYPTVSNDDFNKILLEIIELVKGGYTDLLPRNKEDIVNPLIMINFINKLYQNWKTAQNIICGEILKNYDEIDEINQKIRDRNKIKLRNKNDNIDFLRLGKNVLEMRIKKLRNIFNTIIWLMLGDNDYMHKRFYKGTSDNINRKTLSEIFLVADEINKDANKLAILNDLTTFMQVGDLTVLDENQLIIAEVKSGNKNHELFNLLRFINDEDIKSRIQQLSHKDFQQLCRIFKQFKCMKQVDTFLRADKGKHLIFDGEAAQIDTECSTEKFNMVINNVYEELKEKSYAIAEVEKCVYIGIYNMELANMGISLMKKWMEAIKASGELYCFNKIMLEPLATPILRIGLRDELVKDIMCGRIIIYIYVDIIGFINVCQLNNINVGMLSKKQSSKTNALKSRGTLFIFKGKLLAHDYDKEKPIIYGNGFIYRIISSLETPLSIAKKMAERI